MSETPIYNVHEIHYDATKQAPLQDRSGLPFQPSRLKIAFHDGRMSYVCAKGPAIRKNGSLGSSERYRLYTDRRQLTSDTPDWVREFVNVALGVAA
ncbi:hypothetical protein EU244_025110 [Rhodococcus qingshengii]|uniref:hypothetical protein n=1 Tax=Rhodococcus qingshengii TaxID=334542 RepID=UPI0010A5FA7D|nr:hypothetical protein [Rhodococcus qingshengii]THJ70711.1 hypothetical protein EU244_15340 [Rhodococcus qingshengii]